MIRLADPTMTCSDLERFFRRVWVDTLDEGACWVWHGQRHNGYGIFSLGGFSHRAHRVAYEQFIGRVPEGKVVHHACHVRACVNPEHLALLTPSEHSQLHALPRSAATHCRNGHEFTPRNTRHTTQRFCRACVREHSRRYKAKQTPEPEHGRRGKSPSRTVMV